MRLCVVLAAVIVLAGCGGGHRSASCTLGRGPEVSERTGEHTLVLTVTGCAVRSTPRVELLDEHDHLLRFAFVPLGGRAGSPQRVVLDKYRCDVRATAVARRVRVTLAGERRLELGLGPEPVLDWCPAEPPSSIVRVYLGRVHAPGTYRDVLRDVYDGRLDTDRPCGPLRAAIAHLPVDGPTYSPLPALLGRAAARACGTALAGLPPGAPRAAFFQALGAPSRSGPRCAVWRWPPAAGAVDGARACFAHGRAALVQTALHG